MAFKIPLLQSKSLSEGYFEGLPSFAWGDVTEKDEIGRGSFGSVMKGKYSTKGKVVVVKRFFGEGNLHLKNIAKEAKMLASLDHPNITKFLGVCSKPVAIMMQYESFNFNPFGLDHQTSNLLEFLSTLDRIEGETEAFEHFLPVFPKAAEDVAKGLRFLHSNGIVHRDLKPSNVLVNNLHYSTDGITVSSDELPRVFADCPVVCKLTDFGESRSNLLQTATIIHAKTRNIERGTKPYMAPEIVLEGRLSCATMDDLKAIDVWALGMTFFNIINPDIQFPYEIELSLSSEKAPDRDSKFEQLLKEMLASKSKPRSSKKYQERRSKERVLLDRLHYQCTAFDPMLRPSAENVLMELNGKTENEPSFSGDDARLEVRETKVFVISCFVSSINFFFLGP